MLASKQEADDACSHSAEERLTARAGGSVPKPKPGQVEGSGGKLPIRAGFGSSNQSPGFG